VVAAAGSRTIRIAAWATTGPTAAGDDLDGWWSGLADLVRVIEETAAAAGRDPAAMSSKGSVRPLRCTGCCWATGSSAEVLVDDPRVALISATGSTRMGRAVGPRVAARFGRVLLELGGNNATVVAPSADLELALQTSCAAAGTVGRRCTTLRSSGTVMG
jgi:acyl-CoA reductase-like NAD-dependent aldehyde dehydrogenase